MTRFDLAESRIREIVGEAHDAISPKYAPWFAATAEELVTFLDEVQYFNTCNLYEEDPAILAEHNKKLYADILPEHYDRSWCNPAYARQELGDQIGSLLSAASYEMRSVIPYLFDDCYERAVIRLELFLELYTSFSTAYREAVSEGRSCEDSAPEASYIQRILYDYLSDYALEEAEYEIIDKLTPNNDRILRWLMESDLDDPRYLYAIGEYISENEIQTAQFLATIPDQKLAAMADTFTEGYRIGFEVTGKNLSLKKTVGIIYHYGFEKMMRRAVHNFEDLEKDCSFYRSMETLFRLGASSGCESSSPNEQYAYDHREDLALFLDEALLQRKLQSLEQAYKHQKEQTVYFAGPAVEETFGQKPFSPKQGNWQSKFNEAQQKMVAKYRSTASGYYNEAVIGQNRSFTIISFPIPEIADTKERFEEIFDAVIQINTLDYREYQTIQQTLIDELDHADRLHIVGKGQNRTDLTVNLWKLSDPEKETIFENCVADVNIPVGEVFTSPVLSGTDGILHVTGVYLEGLYFKDLAIRFKDGMTAEYSCENFADEEDGAQKGRAYIEENILFHHKSLPMGECAIGTNTTAYAAGIKYGISGLLPILIAEKTGPHFAVGDTCYSREEENRIYNPDGKEIVAKDNAVSCLRTERPEEAYFGCHTDITIPYAELGILEAIDKQGNAVPIIEDGRFVLAGCEKLNEAFDRL